MKRTQQILPTIKASFINFLALAEASWAAAVFPAATPLLTCVAKIIAGIASGQQQKTEMIEGTR
jgi:hypothetical protein